MKCHALVHFSTHKFSTSHKSNPTAPKTLLLTAASSQRVMSLFIEPDPRACSSLVLNMVHMYKDTKVHTNECPFGHIGPCIGVAYWVVWWFQQLISIKKKHPFYPGSLVIFIINVWNCAYTYSIKGNQKSNRWWSVDYFSQYNVPGCKT